MTGLMLFLGIQKFVFFSVVLFSLFYDVDNEFLLPLVFAPISSSFFGVSAQCHIIEWSRARWKEF